LKTLLVERWTSQQYLKHRKLSRLSFPRGISGSDLAEREQSCRFGTKILLLRDDFPPGCGVAYLTDGTHAVTRASICATRVAYRHLDLPGEEGFPGIGLFAGLSGRAKLN
jgi:thioredoxin reductase